MSPRAQSAGLFLAVVVAIWLTRTAALDRVVTPDEHIWLARSANFYYAIAHAEPGGTLQFVHPGVSVMWVGAAAFLLKYPSYFHDAPGQVHQWFDSALTNVFIEHGRTPLDLLIASRGALIVIHALVLGLAYLQAVKLLGRGPATTGMLLIAFNPFHIGLSQILHLDSMTSNLMLVSTVGLLNYRLRGEQRRDLIVSAIAAGVAWLTRSSALFLLPYAGLVLATALPKDWSRPRALAGWPSLLRTYIGWTGLGLGVFVLLWPAMWVRPVEIIKKMYLVNFRMAAEGHELPLFYAGTIVQGDPGILFYPVTYLWRTTPVSLAGLIIVIIAIATPGTESVRRRLRGPLIMLILFSAFFTILLTLGAKKFDRYLLPVYPPLDLVAGAGWFAVADWLRHQRGVVVRLAGPVIIAAAVGGQALSAGLAYPYYLGYYNPLLGGVDAASRTMMLGWGEGLDQVADYVNALPHGDEPRVLAQVWPSSLSYFLDGDLVPATFAPTMRTVAAWLTSDYYVLYRAELQRGLVPQEIVDYLSDRKPVMVARVHGFPYAYLYEIRDEAPPQFLVTNDPCATDFGSTVRFLAYEWGDAPPRSGDEISVAVYVQTIAPVPAAMRVRLRLLSQSGQVVSADETNLSPTVSGTIQTLNYGFVIPRGTSPETSRFAMTVYDPTTGNALQAEDTRTGRSRGRTARLHC